jgi:hypothetical protein
VATLSRRFNALAQSTTSWDRVRAIAVYRYYSTWGSLKVTTEDGQSHSHTFLDLRDLVRKNLD